MYAVKLGYNDHGYIEFMAVTTKICRNIWSITNVSLVLISLISYLHADNDVIAIPNKYP